MAEHRLQYTLKENQRLKEELRTAHETTQQAQARTTQLTREHKQETEALRKLQQETETALRDTCNQQLQSLHSRVDSLVKEKRSLKDQLRECEDKATDLQRQLECTQAAHQHSLQLKEVELAAVPEQIIQWQTKHKQFNKHSWDESPHDPYT